MCDYAETPLAKVCRMIRADPSGEVHLFRDGKHRKGYLAPNGVLFHAAVIEVDLDVSTSVVNIDELLNNQGFGG